MPDQASYLRTLLVDDNECFLKSMGRLLARESLIKVVGSAASGNEAIQLARLLQPDLILMDISMEGMNGIEATSIIKSQPDAPRIIILSLNDSETVLAATQLVQADGFISKVQAGNELMPLIRNLFLHSLTPMSLTIAPVLAA